MATIPRGSFLEGAGEGFTAPLELPPLPLRRVEMPEFSIDRVPVTERDYARFVDETSRALSVVGRDADPTIDAALVAQHDRARASVLDRYGPHPAVLVAWDDARDYCAWRHARLPTEEEWEKAVRGVDGRAFPWGDRADPARINSRELGAGDTAPVLSYPRARSPFEVYDGAGNAAEWTSTSGSSPEHFIVRGSAWNEPAAAARTHRRRQLARSARSVTVTFRCASTPPT